MTRSRCAAGLVVLVLIVLARAEDPVKPAAKNAPPAVKVPFELLDSGHMAVQVKVNGNGPYKLIFDTGAPITLVNNKVARAAGLLKGAQAGFFPGIGTVAEVKIKSLQVGGQRAENVPAVVMDHPTVELISQKFGPIDGIVGFPFFARFKLTLDYQAKTMTFVPSGYNPPDATKEMLRMMLGIFVGAGRTVVLAPAGQWGVEAAKEIGDAEPGVTVRRVVPGSAAAAAGLKKGDRLLTLDGRWTDSVADLYAAAAEVKPGTTVALKILRGAREMVLKATPVKGL
jgi:hypothetical protein